MFDHFMSTSALAFTLIAGLVTLLVTFFAKLYHARMLVIRLQQRGLPVAPEHSFLFGHLLYFNKFIERLPIGAHHHYPAAIIAREVFPHTGAYYLDLWPFGDLFITIFSPQITTEITQTNTPLTCERPSIIRQWFKTITGGPTIFDMGEEEWRPWRAIFNKGFQGDHIMSFVPAMVQETMVYAETLSKAAAKGEICFLDPITLRFTIDMIGRTILNINLGAQKGHNVLADSMLSQIHWHNTGAGVVGHFGHLHPVRRFMQWRNSRRMDLFIGEELDKRYEEYKEKNQQQASSNQKKTKSIMDLVFQAYLSSTQSSSQKNFQAPLKLDPTFRTTAIRHFRLFLFSGHDSMSSALVYTFHLLSRNPHVLSRLRAEHDRVLGPDANLAPALLSQNPHLVNSLPYTLAVIKESLRLFPPAGTTRAGKPGITIRDETGNLLPTDNATLWVLHNELHTSPKYWPRANEFLPERWLSDDTDRENLGLLQVERGNGNYPPVPPTSNWRAFEQGPRNCIAQGLVLVELRVILAILVRRFDIQGAYDEWDSLNDGKGKGKKSGIRTVDGERAYQVAKGAAHPVDGFPCWVYCASLAENQKGE
ncbi:sterigmatocystin biosynthesis P450 monooxygenase StcS [Rhypophila decipiens]|uniref:Sterigmatocystin biosynthesis P450 monooxygenase StcS n=1 Tax=Rhypophila decipiens TaxID=261697 RepID=A0AAN6Y7Y4_9PEZI|nr:sterigmatocystin biosynthesis P450 monooxygenase StcS [Rhypophila decipiens]